MLDSLALALERLRPVEVIHGAVVGAVAARRSCAARIEDELACGGERRFGRRIQERHRKEISPDRPPSFGPVRPAIRKGARASHRFMRRETNFVNKNADYANFRLIFQESGGERVRPMALLATIRTHPHLS